MNLSISKKTLSAVILPGTGIIPSNPVNDSMRHLHIEAKEALLTVTATDGEITIRTKTELGENIRENDTVDIDAMTFKDIITNLDGKTDLCLESVSKDTLKLKWDNGGIELPAFDPKDFTVSGDITPDHKCNSDCGSMKKAISSVMFATDSSNDNPILSAVLFDIRQRDINCVATDRNTLAINTVYTNQETDAKGNRFIISYRAAALLKKLLPTKDDIPVDVAFDNTNVRFSFQDTCIFARLIPNPYPDYAKFFALNFPTRVTARRGDLLSALQRVSVCADKAAGTIKLAVGPAETLSDLNGTMKVSGQDSSYMMSSEEDIPVDLAGENITIGFKHATLITALSQLEDETVILHLTAPNKPAKITSTDKDNPFQAIMMPVQVKS